MKVLMHLKHQTGLLLHKVYDLDAPLPTNTVKLEPVPGDERVYRVSEAKLFLSPVEGNEAEIWAAEIRA